ncbi:putative tripartite motif-containing protein 75 [Dendronephthya gigantea]|uniref:putative tripartite motif-containing protein 75 n=1 Tax=Dendronephthya gigantea TaxID=151771 RepID=UPI00106B98EC|nr:putative tripartite motif-containing protein 75 [Dendronephthya gigantea]
MAEKPSNSASELAELVTCSICLENIRDARALPCLHTFCKECLQSLVTPRGDLTCPHCRKKVKVPNGDASKLNPNFYVNNIIDVLNSKKGGEAPAPAPAIVDRTSRAQLCTNHPGKECELFCLLCFKFICRECNLIWSVCSCLHFHVHVTIDKAAAYKREHVEELLHEKEELMSGVKNHLDTLKQMKAIESRKVLDVSQQINDSFAKHMKKLKNRQEALLKQASDLQRKNDDGLSSEVNQFQLKQAKIQSSIECCRKTLEIDNPVLFLQRYPEFQADSDEFETEVNFVTEVELDNLLYQATDSCLTEAISSFGKVVTRDECDDVEEESPMAPKKSQKNRSRRRGRRQGGGNEHGPLGADVYMGHTSVNRTGIWSGTLYNRARGNASPVVTFENCGTSVKTTSERNAAIIGKPGFLWGKHSWKIKAVGFAHGISLGVCVGENGCGIVVTYDSQLTPLNTALGIRVELDCDAKRVSVSHDGREQTRDVVGFDNPHRREVYPYFYLPPPGKHHFSKISILSIDGAPVVGQPRENEPQCSMQ